ncbi:MAG: hypothetical protein RL320_708 [Pseudomonadota bacterium]
MLIDETLYDSSVLSQAGDFAAESGLTDLGASQAKHAERATGPARQLATITEANGARIAGECLQRESGLITLFLGFGLISDDSLEGRAFRREFLNRLFALLLAINQ